MRALNSTFTFSTTGIITILNGLKHRGRPSLQVLSGPPERTRFRRLAAIVLSTAVSDGPRRRRRLVSDKVRRNRRFSRAQRGGKNHDAEGPVRFALPHRGRD